MLSIHHLPSRTKSLTFLGTKFSRRFSTESGEHSFSHLFADEVTDSSAIVLRYVDPDDLQIREDLVEFVECDAGVTGRAVAEKMTGFIQSSGLDLNKLRGRWCW